MGLLTREDILKADDRPTETVHVPEWGGDVLVRGLDGRGRDSYFATHDGTGRGNGNVMDTTNATAKLVASCIVTEDGEPLFTMDDVNALGAKSGAALNRVFDAAQRLSGLSDDDLDELKKASEPTPNGRSTSGSHRSLPLLGSGDAGAGVVAGTGGVADPLPVETLKPHGPRPRGACGGKKVNTRGL